MIGKAGLGSFAKGILEYCYYEKELTEKKRRQMTMGDIRGELVYVQHLTVKLLADKRETQDKRLLTLKDLIDHLLPEAETLQELKEELLKKSYKTYIGRGIAFSNPKNRMKIKGSDLGRKSNLICNSL